MDVNKIEYGGRVLLDLTEDTVAEDQLLEGATAHDRSGQRIVGALINLAEDTVAPENLLAGATAHDSSGQQIVGTMIQSSGGSGGVQVKTGTTTSTTINTGLSKIDKLIIYTESLSNKGAVDIIYTGESEAVVTYCSYYSNYSKSCAVQKRSAFSVSDGIFEWDDTGYYAFASGVTYHWIAIGS